MAVDGRKRSKAYGRKHEYLDQSEVDRLGHQPQGSERCPNRGRDNERYDPRQDKRDDPDDECPARLREAATGRDAEPAEKDVGHASDQDVKNDVGMLPRESVAASGCQAVFNRAERDDAAGNDKPPTEPRPEWAR